MRISVPVIPVEASVLNGLRDVFRAHCIRAVKIRDGSRDFQNPVVRAGGKTHPPHRHFKSAFSGFIERALLANGGRRHARIAPAPGLLHFAGSLGALPHIG